MERIVYRIPLDATKSGIQGTLQGFMTGDILSRRIEITLSSRGESVVLTENEAAAMYVHKTGADEPSINACTIEDGKAIYDVLQSDVDTVGITKMQLKIVSGERVLMSPYFAIEVTDSMTGDTQAVTTPTYSALEQALAQAQTVYNERIVSVSLSEDLLFRVDYADGNFYESTAIADKVGNIDVAEAERVRAEELRVSAEEERAFAERNRVSLFTAMQNSIQNALDTTEALQESLVGLVEAQGVTAEEKEAWNKKADGIKYVGATLSLLSGEETIATTTIVGGDGGSVVLPDNVLVASEVTAADVEAPKINADLFGSRTPESFANADAVQNIINGTQQVGNAKTLDGHEAEYFVNRTDVLTGSESILEKAKTLGYGMWNFRFNNHDGTGLPNEYYANGCATVFVRTSSHITVVLWGSYYGISSRIQTNHYNGVTWTGWIEEFTTAGGTIDGNITLETTGSSTRAITLKNAIREVTALMYASDGFYALRDITSGKNIIESKANGANTFNGTASGNLPLSGGRISANSTVPLELQATNSVDTLIIPLYNRDGEAIGSLGFRQGIPIFRIGTGTWNEALHTGNKPTGTYTGNGEATRRTINVGGTSECFIVKGRSSEAMVIVTPSGYFGKNHSGEFVSGYGSCFAGNKGEMTIQTTDSAVNANGIVYDYYSV